MEDSKRKTPNSDYHLKLNFNGKDFEFKTKDIKSTLMSVKPNLALKTNVKFHCSNTEVGVCEKVVLAKRARMFWKNPIYMDMFINQLIFKKA